MFGRIIPLPYLVVISLPQKDKSLSDRRRGYQIPLLSALIICKL